MLNDYGKSLFKPWCSVPNAVWCFALIYLAWLMITVYDLNSSDVASWVQAFGSVAAIVFAAYLPIWHGRVSLKQRQNSLAEIMRVISDDAADSLRLISNSFLCPERERGQMARYEVFHRGRDWAALIDQLAQIPVAELSPASARDLSYLKDAVSFGAFVALKIPDWIKDGGHSRPDIVRVLRVKRDLVELIRSRLPVPQGIDSQDLSLAQLTTQVIEMRRPQLEPIVIEDAEIYRRYVWRDELSSMPEYVYIQGIYPYFDSFGPSILEFDSGFSNFLDLDLYVQAMCRRLHEEHISAEIVRMGQGAL